MFVPQAPPTEVFLGKEGDPPDYAQIETTLAEDIGTNLRSVRSHLGLGQRDLSERMQVSLSQYRKYEAGRDLPRLHSALLWSIETGLPTHWLFYGSRYQQWLQLPFRPAWTPVLYFANRAPDWALAALHSVLTGLLKVDSPDDNPFISVDQQRRALSAQLVRDPYYRAIAEKLRDFRMQHGLSQDGVARQMGISQAAYRKYETPELCPHYSVNLIMRFWMATGVSPLSLSTETPVYRYREVQNRNFAILLPWLEQLDDAGLARVNELSRVLAEAD